MEMSWRKSCDLSCHLHSGWRFETGFAFEANKKLSFHVNEGLVVGIFL